MFVNLAIYITHIFCEPTKPIRENGDVDDIDAGRKRKGVMHL